MTTSLNELRLPDGTVLNAAEWLHYPVYSMIEIAAGDAINLSAFSYIVGGTVPHTPTLAARTATELDTNLQRRRKMGQDEALVVHAITYEVCALNDVPSPASPPAAVVLAPAAFATDLRRLQRNCIISLLVGAGMKKGQVEVPFSYIPQAIGAQAYTSGDAGALPAMNIHYGTGGDITPRGQRVLNLPVYIGGFGENAKPGNKMRFELKFRSPTGAPAGLLQNLALRWWLDALKKRPA